MGSTSLLLATVAISLLAHQTSSVVQPDLPWWAGASLAQEDIGPGFEITRSEFFSQDAFASYLVQFERSTAATSGGVRAIGSLLIRNDRSPLEPDFDELAAAIVRQRPGLQRVEGPAVGADVRWYAGPWSDVPGEDEAHVVVARLGLTVLSVAVAGDPGSVRQADVLALAALVFARLTNLAPSPTPTATAVPEVGGTPEPSGTQLMLPFPPTPTPAPILPQAPPSTPSPGAPPAATTQLSVR